MSSHRQFRARIRLVSVATALAIATTACSDGTSTRPVPDTSGRLFTKFAAPTQTVATGLSVQTEPATGRPFGVYVPTGYSPSTRWPLAVLLHGNGASGEGMVLDFDAFAEEAGVVIVTPNSRGQTWDRILATEGEYGPDVVHIDAVLKWAFDHIAVDPARVSLGGFSDGATYSVLIGLKNGDLFTRIAGLTPCVDVPDNRLGMPLVFISHGIHDQILPIDDCSRFTVPRLRDRGYTVEFVEYDSDQGNGHFITEAVATQAMNFMAGR